MPIFAEQARKLESEGFEQAMQREQRKADREKQENQIAAEMRRQQMQQQHSSQESGLTRQHDMAKMAEEEARKKRALEELLGRRKDLPQGSRISYDGASIDTPDPLANFFRGEAVRARNEKTDEAMVQGLSKRVTDEKIGETQQTLQNLRNSVDKNGFALGGISSALPGWAVAAGENLGLASPGATEQLQAIEGIKAFRRSPLYGSALTPQEQQSFDTAFGLLSTGSDEQKTQAMNTLVGMYNKASSNLGAAYPQRVKDTYQQRGGLSLQPMQQYGKTIQVPEAGKAPAAGAPPSMSFEEFKAAKRAGKL